MNENTWQLWVQSATLFWLLRREIFPWKIQMAPITCPVQRWPCQWRTKISSHAACRKVNKSKLSNDYFRVYYFFALFFLRTTLKEIKNLLNHRDDHCLTIHFIRMFRPRESHRWLAGNRKGIRRERAELCLLACLTSFYGRKLCCWWNWKLRCVNFWIGIFKFRHSIKL